MPNDPKWQPLDTNLHAKSLKPLDFTKLQVSDLASLQLKETAARAEADPDGPDHQELGLFAQGLAERTYKVHNAASTVGVDTQSSPELDLIPFPFVSTEGMQALGAKVRVFIMGVEVSDYVASASWAGNAATSDLNCNASLTLKCPHDLLTLTPKNLDTTISVDQVNWVVSTSSMYNEQAKRDIYEYKRQQNYFERTTAIPRWNLAPNTCIFHHADTVRIFVHLPWSQKDAWLPVFTGYLQSPQVARQTNGEDEITMSCDTLAARLAKARVFNQMNAELLSPKGMDSRLPTNQEFTGITNIDIVDTSILFADAFGVATNALLDTSLEGLLRFTFYGDLSQSAKILSSAEDKHLQELLVSYFNKYDALRALKSKGKALGVDYSNQIEVLSTEVQGLFGKIKADPEAKKKKVVVPVLGPDSKVLKTKGPDGKEVVQEKVLDTLYNTSTLRGKRALGFLDPKLFILDYEFPFSGEIVAPTSSEPAKASTSTSSQTDTVFTKIIPVKDVSSSNLIVSSGFGNQEIFRNSPHKAIDIPVKNAPVVAPISGRVLEVNLDGRHNSGIFVRLLGDDGYVHDLFHLDRAEAVKFGTPVSVGGQLGISGNTGHTVGKGGGYHLHWGVWKWDDPIPNWDEAPVEVTHLDRSIVNPLVWLSTDSVVGAKTVSAGATGLPKNLDQSSIDWEVEVRMFEQWKKNCLVGWANGVPDTSQVQSSVDTSNFVNTDCYEIARDRNRAYLSSDEVTVIGRNSGFLGQYSPHGQNVAIVLRKPKAGWGYNYGATTDWRIQEPSFEINTQTRAQILMELLGKVDYYWWVSGNGDIIFDFPNYEMLPNHYGEKFQQEYEFYGLGVNDVMQEDISQLKSTYIFRGGIGGPVQSDAGKMESLSRIYPAIFKLPTIAARNGIEVEDVYWPHITSQQQLKVLGALQIRKHIANSFKYSISGLPPLLYVTPNTAVYLGDLDAYALVNSTSFSYSSAGNISCTLEFTAVRQKLTAEQLYLKFKTPDSSSGAAEVTSSDLNKFLKDWRATDSPAKNNSDVVRNSLQATSALYGFMFGTGELLIDYTKTYSQNILATKDWSVPTSDKEGAYASGNITVFQDLPGSPRLISTPTAPAPTTGSNDEVAAPDSSSGLFQAPVQPSPDQIKAVVAPLADLDPHGNIAPAILAHGNVTTGLQDRWTMPSFSSVKDLLSKGVGFLNLTSKVLGQLDRTLGSLGQIGDRIGKISDASFDAVASLQSAGKSLQQVTARHEAVDPRMDPYFSGLAAAAIAKQTVQHVNKTQPQSIKASEIHPDVFAYALHLGPKDPALLDLLAKQDLRDTSDANAAIMGRALQNSMWKMGGYTKRDLDYVDALQNMKKQAAKRGLHS